MIEIFDKSGIVRFSTPINEGCIWKKELMKEEYVLLKFSLEYPIYFQMGDFTEINSRRFEIIDIVNPSQNTSTGGFDYELRLDADYFKWKNKKLFYNRNRGGEANWSLTATLDVHLSIILANLIYLGYKYNNSSYEFNIDDTVENSAKLVTYDNTNIIDALTKIAETWECEWWITNNFIHFGRCEFHSPVKFECEVEVKEMTRVDSSSTFATRIYAFGSERNIPSTYRKKLFDKLQRIDTIPIMGSYVHGNINYKSSYFSSFTGASKIRFLNSSTFYEISGVTGGGLLYIPTLPNTFEKGSEFQVYGFTEDIPSHYLSSENEGILSEGVVQNRLMLPQGTNFVGNKDIPEEEAVEEVVIFKNVYPRRIGTISEISTHEYTDKTEDDNGNEISEQKWNAYRFKDSGLIFSEKYLIKGDELRIVFQSGSLNGMDFAVWFNPYDEDSGETQQQEKNPDGSWNPLAQVFEIVRNEDYGRSLPDETLYPKVGDTYILYGFDTNFVSEALIPNAEMELLEKAEKHLEKSMIDPSVYNCTMNSHFMYNAYEGSGVFPDVGDKVTLINPAYFKESRESRIIGFEIKLDKMYDSPVYMVGETSRYSRIGEIEGQLEELTYKGQNFIGLGGGSGVYVVGRHDRTSPTDKNVLSSIRTLYEISNSVEELRKETIRKFLRKDAEDTASERITFDNGIVVRTREEINLNGNVSHALRDEGSLLEESADPSSVSPAILERVDSTEKTLGGLDNVSASADTAPEGSLIVMRGGAWVPEQRLPSAAILVDLSLPEIELWRTFSSNMEGRFIGYSGGRQFELTVSWDSIGSRVEIFREEGQNTEIILLEKDTSGAILRSEEYIEFITI